MKSHVNHIESYDRAIKIYTKTMCIRMFLGGPGAWPKASNPPPREVGAWRVGPRVKLFFLFPTFFLASSKFKNPYKK